MSLWDGLKEIGGAAYGSAIDRVHKIQEYMDKYEDDDDERLKKMYSLCFSPHLSKAQDTAILRTLK